MTSPVRVEEVAAPDVPPAFWTGPAPTALDRVWRARAAGAVVGWLVVREGPDAREVLHIEVAPHARRGGVGRALLEVILGGPPVWLEVRDSNVAARALYGQLGFVIDGRRPRYYPTAAGGREDAVLMSWRPAA